MKFTIFIVTLLFVHNLSAAQQRPNLKRAGSPIQNLDERPNTRTTTTTSSVQPVQSLDEEEIKMVCEQQPSMRTIGTQTDMQVIAHELDKYLLSAARANNLPQIQELFDPKNNFIPDINARDMQPIDPNGQEGPMDQMTPLMIAADKGYMNIVKFLIKQGANLNLETTGGLTALMIALDDVEDKYGDYSNYNEYYGLRHSFHPEIAEILLNAGADVNAGSYSITPLALALNLYRSAGDYESNFAMYLIEKIISSGAKFTGTELERYIYFPQIVEVLLKYGANPYLRNENGQNFFDVVRGKAMLPVGVRFLARDYEKVQTPQHIAALQAVAQKSMQGLSSSARHEGMEEPAMLVQQYLRPDYRTEALQHENKEKEEKDNKERSSLAPITDEK